jgi:3-hydroxybutyryl-CoA dehydrogenase
MQVVVLTNDILKDELVNHALFIHNEVIWIENIAQFSEYENAEAFIDLLFEASHIAFLKNLLPRFIIINSVEETLAKINTSFIRFNGWAGFLKSSIIEASCYSEQNRKKAEAVFDRFQKKLQWLPDEVGFITPRIISMIINEAFIALKEGVSTKEEIDTAMKLGTNYPYGPFEWAEKIGVEKIETLLKELSQQQKRYTPFHSME